MHPGTYSITGHDGDPCTFYETTVLAGEYDVCCGECWGSGLFLSTPAVPNTCAKIQPFLTESKYSSCLLSFSKVQKKLLQMAASATWPRHRQSASFTTRHRRRPAVRAAAKLGSW